MKLINLTNNNMCVRKNEGGERKKSLDDLIYTHIFNKKEAGKKHGENLF